MRERKKENLVVRKGGRSRLKSFAILEKVYMSGMID